MAKGLPRKDSSLCVDRPQPAPIDQMIRSSLRKRGYSFCQIAKAIRGRFWIPAFAGMGGAKSLRSGSARLSRRRPMPKILDKLGKKALEVGRNPSDMVDERGVP